MFKERTNQGGILLYALSWPAHLWEGAPLRAVVRERHLFGRGAGDMKAGIVCPCTLRAAAALDVDLHMARRLGFKAKCVVFPEYVEALNSAFTPLRQQVAAALALCAAFELQKSASPAGLALWIDAPLYNNAKRLLARHAKFLTYLPALR